MRPLFCVIVLAIFEVVAAAEKFALPSPIAIAAVLKVVDGDTLLIRRQQGPMPADPEQEMVRLIGIDTPEQGYGGRPEWGAEAATTQVRDWLPGRRLQLVLDPANLENNHRDRYGRLLAYVEDEQGEDLGLLLMREGRARLFRSFAFARRQKYMAAQEEARRNRKGLWSEGEMGEFHHLRQAGGPVIHVYPLGADLWAVCVSRRVRLGVTAGELLPLLRQIRRLFLQHTGSRLQETLEQEGFVTTGTCNEHLTVVAVPEE